MVTITFPDRETEAKGLDYLRYRFLYRQAADVHVIPDAAADALTGQRIPYTVVGRPPATVHRDPDIMGGVPVFVGTRVPTRFLTDHLAAGAPLDEFLDSYPSVSKEQAAAYLEAAQEAMDAHAHFV